MSERPIVEETPETAGLGPGALETRCVKERWAYNNDELRRFLAMVFEWKRGGRRMADSDDDEEVYDSEDDEDGNNQVNIRDVLFLAGGLQIGAESLITQRSSREVLRQITIGPVCDDVLKFSAPLSGKADDEGAYEFAHVPMKRPQCNYALLKITTPFTEQAPTVEARIVGAVERPARCLLGPILVVSQPQLRSSYLRSRRHAW